MGPKRKVNEVLIIIYVLIFCMSFSFVGWAMAEQDNQILRDELVLPKHSLGDGH
ncbi:hypothetical protein [Acinetobacter pittii]|uniref:hypothetical protein n=1 Tax=Acinetobacter pittii TaxID=48296 RepID=UPI0002D06EC2|nr:hypothetical protein [Acinetobacter pittii]ENW10157.1 hypothetical protein F928_03002 [Acinetobacter pittii ATCC 19004 = CIP 70.29]MCK0919489.1 hypothetical protein [Acinetobacter pittii]QXA12804.1 hypothetical protein I6L29_05710 [Acinetobacter pittii]